jgi:ribonuclease VapC
MILDTSALVALLFEEPEAEKIARAIAEDPVREMSALSLLELFMVVESRKGPFAIVELETLLGDLHVEIQPLDVSQARRAFAAWRRFGKGRHPAALNLGDCCTFALAAARGDSILFKGEDFGLTDCAKVALDR